LMCHLVMIVKYIGLRNGTCVPVLVYAVHIYYPLPPVILYFRDYVSLESLVMFQQALYFVFYC